MQIRNSLYKLEDLKELDFVRKMYGPEEEFFRLRYKNTDREYSKFDPNEKTLELRLIAINKVNTPHSHRIYAVYAGWVAIPDSQSCFGQRSVFLKMTSDMWEIGWVIIPGGLNKVLMEKQIMMAVNQCAAFDSSHG